MFLDDAATAPRVVPLRAPAAARAPFTTITGPLPGQALDGLVTACAAVPAAITLTPARLAADPTPHSDPLPTPVLETTVDDALTHAHDALAATDPRTARLYRVLGTLPLPGPRIDAPMAAAAAGLDPVTAGHAFDTLVERRLVTPLDSDSRAVERRYAFQSADGRRHAARLAHLVDGPDSARTCQLRALDWLVAEAHVASRILAPHRPLITPELQYLPAHRAGIGTRVAAHAWFAGRDLDLLGALHTARDAGLDYHSAFLGYAAWPWLLLQRDYPQWIAVCDISVEAAHRLAVTAPRRGSGRMLLRELLGARATALRAVGRTREAIRDCEHALEQATEDRDAVDEARALHDLGAAHHQDGQPRRAYGYLDQAYRARMLLGRTRDAGVTLVQVAEVLADLGDHPAALTCLYEARRILLTEGDPLNAARALAWTGRLRALTGDTAAGADLDAALTEFEAHHSLPWQARVLNWKGLLAEDQGHTDDAIALHHRALALYTGSAHDTHRVRGDLARLGVDA
ncbi:tetratricopeptide repeat protein [Kitasatospora sp. NPDC088160]|uniref:tetratricopeptide repeat protein n=1 Tax=Kitasatospora sp. NPDC088160 TaxID=3364072 RepID=UPI0038119303